MNKLSKAQREAVRELWALGRRKICFISQLEYYDSYSDKAAKENEEYYRDEIEQVEILIKALEEKLGLGSEQEDD